MRQGGERADHGQLAHIASAVVAFERPEGAHVIITLRRVGRPKDACLPSNSILGRAENHNRTTIISGGTMSGLLQNFNLADEFNMLRLICGLFFIPHIYAKFFVPEALGFFVAAKFKPPALWIYMACASKRCSRSDWSSASIPPMPTRSPSSTWWSPQPRSGG